jgi:hypothetical protein
MTEIWKPLPGEYGLVYDVSNLGRVRSLHGKKPRILIGSTNSDGYRIMVLFDGRGGRKGFPLHRLVAETFLNHNRSPLHCEVAHLDGNRKNARADNLKWVSKVENHSHKRLHGTWPSGEGHPRARLTWDAVRAIRASSERYSDLASRYGVSFHTISDIRRGIRWKDESAAPQGFAQKEAP